MENKSKSTTLVAWTDKGRVLMVPWLLDEMREQYFEEILREKKWADEGPRWEAEINHLLRKSHLWEEYGDFLLRAGLVWDAYECFECAALEPLCCSDCLWCDTETSQQPVTPLLYRFYAIYHRCRKLSRQYPRLQLKFNGSWLERKYEEFTTEENESLKALIEYDKVWNFGKNF